MKTLQELFNSPVKLNKHIDTKEKSRKSLYEKMAKNWLKDINLHQKMFEVKNDLH